MHLDELGIYDVLKPMEIEEVGSIVNEYIESLFNTLNKTLTPVIFWNSLHLQVQKWTKWSLTEENSLLVL